MISVIKKKIHKKKNFNFSPMSLRDFYNYSDTVKNSVGGMLMPTKINLKKLYISINI
jgi:hypothetical protein